MKILVTGITGQLGYDAMKYLARTEHEAIGAARTDFALTDLLAMRKFFERHRPDALLHAAAYTAVDRAEEERAEAYAVNADGVRALAALCREYDAKLLCVGTDYVFEGVGARAYEVSDGTAPQNVYGASKCAGEEVLREILERHFIVRTSWVFGKNGSNFIRTMLNLAKTRSELTVVDDQIGSPTYTADLAPLLVRILESEEYGTYHATNEGFCSWAEFAREIFVQAQKVVRVIPVESSAYPVKAKRPLNSRLSKQSLDRAFYRLPHWRDAVGRYLKELRDE